MSEKYIEPVYDLDLHFDFQRIARRSLGAAIKADSKKIPLPVKGFGFNKAKAQAFARKAYEKTHALQSNSFSAIIYSALAVEAFINFYYITARSKGSFDHLDKLSVEAKWLLIPELITGTKLEPGSKVMQQLSKLINYRNNLVHYKVKKLTLNQVIEFHDKNLSEAKFAVKAMSDLFEFIIVNDSHANKIFMDRYGDGLAAIKKNKKPAKVDVGHE